MLSYVPQGLWAWWQLPNSCGVSDALWSNEREQCLVWKCAHVCFFHGHSLKRYHTPYCRYKRHSLTKVPSGLEILKYVALRSSGPTGLEGRRENERMRRVCSCVVPVQGTCLRRHLEQVGLLQISRWRQAWGSACSICRVDTGRWPEQKLGECARPVGARLADSRSRREPGLPLWF